MRVDETGVTEDRLLNGGVRHEGHFGAVVETR
jgi:hypothetical protein